MYGWILDAGQYDVFDPESGRVTKRLLIEMGMDVAQAGDADPVQMMSTRVFVEVTPAVHTKRELFWDAATLFQFTGEVSTGVVAANPETRSQLKKTAAQITEKQYGVEASWLGRITNDGWVSKAKSAQLEKVLARVKEGRLTISEAVSVQESVLRSDGGRIRGSLKKKAARETAIVQDALSRLPPLRYLLLNTRGVKGLWLASQTDIPKVAPYPGTYQVEDQVLARRVWKIHWQALWRKAQHVPFYGLSRWPVNRQIQHYWPEAGLPANENELTNWKPITEAEHVLTKLQSNVERRDHPGVNGGDDRQK
ncbi:hypothetical protein [Lacticaseibacillus yichunensis]|uniref:Uncharacterized protein n=1 Tax=Lacticaseibacillus yichunensis TaxID=2486015 RepID=A0ABW4CR15_9LACO|nr:hypothetical protein [Lacticaseibacillus yichunensis]